jgi:hypothetical protein
MIGLIPYPASFFPHVALLLPVTKSGAAQGSEVDATPPSPAAVNGLFERSTSRTPERIEGPDNVPRMRFFWVLYTQTDSRLKLDDGVTWRVNPNDVTKDRTMSVYAVSFDESWGAGVVFRHELVEIV